MSVDLPAPFSPTSAWIWPASTVKLTSRSACTPAKLLLTPRISIIAVIGSRPTAPECSGKLVRRPRIAAAGPVLSSMIFSGKPLHNFPDHDSLELRSFVIAALNQQLLPIALVDNHRLEQIRRHDLDSVVVGLGVVDRDLLAAERRVNHVRGHLGQVAGVLEDGRILLAAQHRLDRRHFRILPDRKS